MAELLAAQVLPGIALGVDVEVFVIVIGTVDIQRTIADQLAGQMRRDATRRDADNPADVEALLEARAFSTVCSGNSVLRTSSARPLSRLSTSVRHSFPGDCSGILKK